MDHSAGKLGRSQLVRAEQKPVSIMTHLLSKFCPTGRTIPEIFISTGLTAKAFLLALKRFKVLGTKQTVSVFRSDASCFGSVCAPSVQRWYDVVETVEIQGGARRCLQRIARAVESWQADACWASRGLYCSKVLVSNHVYVIAIFWPPKFVLLQELSAVYFMEQWLDVLALLI